MNDQIRRAAGPPSWVSFFNPIAKFLLAAGVPMLFNGLVTVRGRKSGLPRTTPLAVIDVSGRRWVWSPWGDGDWVRNLRTAGRATITVRRRTIEVNATELDPTQRVGFFRDVLGPLARGVPFGLWLIRIVDGVDLDHPLEAAESRPVFELHLLRGNGTLFEPTGDIHAEHARTAQANPTEHTQLARRVAQKSMVSS